MNGHEQRDGAKGTSRWTKPLITILIVAAAAVFIFSQLPSGSYPTDLSRIGNGRPALVLAYDPNYAGGGRVMEILNDLRDEYAGKVEFLVAHLGDPQGQSFADRHSAGDGSVLIFAPDGAPAARLHRPEEEAELRHALDAVIAR